MAASYNDMSLLASDTAFGNRVASALWQACVNISNEAWSSTHAARKGFVTTILSDQTTWKPRFVSVASVDTTVIADATQAGTVVLTSGNAATQAALVTDAHLSNAISAAFNAFVSGI